MRSADSPTLRTPQPSSRLRIAATAEIPPTYVLSAAGLLPPTEPITNEAPRIRGYEILSLIGTGGMGVVYKARHRELHRIVAIKMLRGAAISDPEYRERFRTEAEAVARLQHPNIIQVFEVGVVQPVAGEFDPAPFIALEFVDGSSLAKLTVAPQTPRFAARMVETLARAAHAAHQVGVVHRDLKPANVLLNAVGEPKIADFGVAKQMDAERDPGGRFVTQAGIAVGTPEYMAPEQVAGDAPTPSIDIHALGVILYELLTARVPFQGPTPADTMYLVRHQEPVAPRRLQPGLPRDLETICLKCLSKSPGRRYETAAELADDLARWADGRTIRARPVGTVGRTARWARRNPTVAMLSAAIVFISLIGLYGVVWKWREAEYQANEANARANEARMGQYRAYIVAASSALQVHDVGSVSRALESAPPECRNWEWRFLEQKLDTCATKQESGSRVHWALLSRDSESLITVSDDHTARFWDPTQQRKTIVIPNSSDMGRSNLSPDGKTLAYIHMPPNDKKVELHDIAAGRTRAVLNGHDHAVMNYCFNYDSSRIATAYKDGTVRVWENATGKLLLSIKAHETSLGMPAFSADGRILATCGSSDFTLKLWDAETGKPIKAFKDHTWNVDFAAFSPCGKRILVVSQFPSNTLWLWDIPEGKLIAKMPGHTNEITAFEFSPDGGRIVSTSQDQTVRVWDGVNGKLISELRNHTGWVQSAVFSPDGTRFVTASNDRTVRIWESEHGKQVAVLLGHTAEVFRAGYTADGKTIVSSSRDGTLRTWDVRNSERDNTLNGHKSFVYGVAFHSDGERVASASWDGTVRIWNATTGQELKKLQYREGVYVSSVAFHPDGKLLASVGRDDAVRLWDVDTGLEVHHWPVPTNFWQDTRLAFSKQGDYLAVGSKDRTVRLLDVKNRTEAAVLRGHTDTIRDVAFSPDGRWLATAGENIDRHVRIWDVAKREQVAALEGHNDRVYALAFNRSGTLLASSSTDSKVRLWDTSTWTPHTEEPLNHGTNVYSMAFTQDDTRLVCACADRTIRFWDVATWKTVAELRGHKDYVHSIAFSPDGTRLVSGSGDYTLRMWDTLPSSQRGR